MMAGRHGGGRKVPDSPTRMTEFAPLSSDARPAGGFFSRLFKRKSSLQVEGAEESGSSQESSREASREASRTPSREATPTHSEASTHENNGRDPDGASQWVDHDMVVVESDEIPSDSEGGASGMPHSRTLSSVLKRLSNILDRRSQTPQAYKDSDFRQYWMPDSDCKECYECSDKFNTFRRRHHCRICGQIFCSRCCNQEVPGKIMGYTGYLRVCTYCCKVVLSYAQHQEATTDLRALSEDLKHLSSVDEVSGSSSYQEFGWWTPTSKRKGSKTSRVSSIFNEDKQRSSSSPELHSPTSSMNPFDVTPLSEYSSVDNFQHERRILTQDSVQLRELWMLMQHQVDGIEMQSHRHRLRTHPNCVVGSELVDWLIARDKATNRVQAVAIGQALVDAKWLECVTSGDQIFRDEYSLYRPGEAAMREDVPEMTVSVDTSGLADDDDNEPSWFREIRRTDEDADSLSEFNKIPPNVSGGDMPEGAARSVFYVDGTELPPKPKKLKTSLSTSSSDRDPAVLKLSDLLAGAPLEGQFEPNHSKVQVQGQDEGSQDLVPSQLVTQDSTAGLTEELFKGAFAVSNETVPLDVDVPEGWQSTEHLREENGEKLSFERLSKANHEHMRTLTNQLLTREGLSLKWLETIMSVTRKIAQVVRPDVRHEADDMDIRQYVQIKKIPGGSRSNTSIVCGVVCTKNVTHKKMRQQIVNPKILLLRAPIEYQRVENKYSSLEPQILQEDKFLKNCVGRIAALEPDILLVEKSASRVAQEFLLDASITLVLNVKPSVMERVARFTQGDIMSSIDGLVSKSALGFCHTFRLQTFPLPNGNVKTLMYFDGCASHLGCTVALRGGSLAELRKVKQIMHFMTYGAYHAKLETSFLMDEFAFPPPGPDENEFPISGLGSSPSTLLPDRNAALIEEFIKPRTESVEMAEEAFPGVVASKGVVAMFEDSGNQLEKVESSIEGATEKDNTFGWNKSSTQTLVNPKEENREKTETSTESVVSAKKRETGDTDSPSKLQKRSNRESAACEIVQDFSDPLQNYQKSQDESIFQSVVDLKEEIRGNKHHFRKALDDVILSTSPYLKYDVPYLKMDAGEKCVLRKHFPEDIYWSHALETMCGETPRLKFADTEEEKLSKEPRSLWKMNSPHPFVTEKIRAPLEDAATQSLLSDFRARGGRLQHPIGGPGQSANEKSRAELEERGLALSTSWNRRTDCLDPAHHQRIAVLFSSFSYVSYNSPNPCVNPWIVTMDFYGRNDITLGGFLERYCFRETYTCPSESCDTPMVDHIRRFVHESGCIQIVLKRLESPIHGYQNSVLMWGWCRKCKQVTPVAPMSLDTWSMSFAKYLELRFHGNVYTRRAGAQLCSHALHHDHYQYFGSHQIVASFKYVPILLREIALPPIIISIEDSAVSLTTLAEDAKMLSFKGTSVYSSVLEHLHRLKRDAQSDAQAIVISEYITQLQDNKDVFRECVDEIQMKLSACVPSSQGHLDNLVAIKNITVMAPVAHDILDSIVEIKRQIAEAVTNWNNRIQDFDQQQRKLEKTRIGSSVNISSRGSRDHLNTPDTVPTVEGSTSPRWFHREDAVDMETEPTFIMGGGEKSRSNSGTDTQDPDDASGVSAQPPSESDPVAVPVSPPAADSQDIGVGVTPGINAVWPESVHTERTGVCPDFSGSEGSLSGIEKSHEELPTEDATKDASGQGVRGHQRSKSLGDQRRMSKQLSVPHDSSANELDRLERSSKAVKQLFTSLLSSTDSAPIDMPFSADEHPLLPPCDSVPIIVYDQEPSSIIAYTLSSAEYERQLREVKNEIMREAATPSPNLRRNKRDSQAAGLEVQDQDTGKRGGSSVLAFFRGAGRERSPNRTPAKDSSGIDTVRYTPRVDRDSLDESDDFSYYSQNSETDKVKGSKSLAPNIHIELQFADTTAKFYCRVYFAEQFRQLRKVIFPAGEQRYIRSLSRCFTWLARGGKSGSTFCKTQDDRFILKQMSRLEVQSFVEFAPHYFQYVTKAYNEEKPTVLAKILGVYRIGYRNNQTNSALKQDLLVMENLFYDRKITQIFDLKGSMRNRLVHTSGKREEDLVLLDENLLKLCVDTPLYIRPHSKTVLTLAITNDTQFLSSHLVMDYSLLVGIDEARRELVVGIIDYIRTFTWDKKLEMVVKTTYSQLGGHGKMPTVVSPELYRSRFLEAMDRYFLLVPDRWFGLGRNVDC